MGVPISISALPAPLPAYLTLPPAPGPAVLVLHAWWGLTDFERRACDRLAAEGFVALAPDLYRGARPRTEAAAREAVLALDAEAALSDVATAHEHLAERADLAPGARVGILGFSLGGAIGLAAATRLPLRAAVTFYGTIDDLEHAKVACPIQGHFAEHDDYETPEATAACFSALKAAGKDPEFYLYDGTKHWFLDEERPNAYDAAAARLAWERALQFLRRHLL